MSKGKILRSEEATELEISSFEFTQQEDEHEDYVPRIEDIERQAYEKGYKAGESAGFEVGQQKAQVLIERLEQIIREFEEVKERTLSELEPQVFSLAVAIAKRILKEEIKQDPKIIINLIKEAMRRIIKPGVITIKINPSLKELIEKTKPELLEIHQDIKIDLDPQVAPAGPVVTGPDSEVLVDVEGQLTNLLEEMGEKIANTESS